MVRVSSNTQTKVPRFDRSGETSGTHKTREMLKESRKTQTQGIPKIPKTTTIIIRLLPMIIYTPHAASTGRVVKDKLF